MKANEFVKKFGWGEAKRVVNDSTEQCTHYDKIKNNDFWFDNNLRLEWCSFECRWCSPRFQINESELVSVADLKRLVESYELVDSVRVLGRTGYEEVESHLNHCDPKWCHFHYKKWKQAITDVEGCK